MNHQATVKYTPLYFQELLDELNKNFRAKNLIPIKNNGTDFPSVPEHQVDFVFSFGTFVHLDAPVIEGYLQSIRSILRQGGNVVLHYSDMTKIMAMMQGTPDEAALEIAARLKAVTDD